jgi:hypothetical protein
MSYWYDYMVETQRRRDEMEQANGRRHDNHLLRQNQSANTILPRYEAPGYRKQARHESVLATLGDHLVAWGCRLQTRYRRLAETSSNVTGEPLLAQQNAGWPPGCA